MPASNSATSTHAPAENGVVAAGSPSRPGRVSIGECHDADDVFLTRNPKHDLTGPIHDFKFDYVIKLNSPMDDHLPKTLFDWRHAPPKVTGDDHRNYIGIWDPLKSWFAEQGYFLYFRPKDPFLFHVQPPKSFPRLRAPDGYVCTTTGEEDVLSQVRYELVVSNIPEADSILASLYI